MKRVIALKFMLSFDHTQKNLTKALGISPSRCRFIYKRLKWIHKKTDKLSQSIEMILVDKELKSAEKVFGLAIINDELLN